MVLYYINKGFLFMTSSFFNSLCEIPDNSADLAILDCSKFASTLNFNFLSLLDNTERILKKTQAFVFCDNQQLSKLMSLCESRGLYTTLLVWHKSNATLSTDDSHNKPFWADDLGYIVHFRKPSVTFNGDSKLKKKCTTAPTHFSGIAPTLVDKFIKIGANSGDTVLTYFDEFSTEVVS